MKNLLLAALLIVGSSAFAGQECDPVNGPELCKAPEKKEAPKLACEGREAVWSCKAPKKEKEVKLACGGDGMWGPASC